MASRRTDLLGLIVPDARQPFFGEIIHALERAAADRGKMVLVGNSDYQEEREIHYLHAFLGMRVSALILVSLGIGDRIAAELDGMDTRVVLMHERSASVRKFAVVTDDIEGARIATRHLLQHGHTAVACLGGPESAPLAGDPVADHVEGWRKAMADAGHSTEGLLFRAPYNRYDTYGAALRLLAAPDRPTAVFCSTDDQAIGLLRAARELGVAVPGELAVVGFDDVKEAAMTDPPLTTVASDREAMARKAVDIALDPELDAATPGGTDRTRRFPSRLVLRASCGCQDQDSTFRPLAAQAPAAAV